MTKHEQYALPVEKASVQERQVTIRILTIGTKQITQTLFRQLLEENVIDEQTGFLKGDVWGWVNLHGDCNERIPHFHIIWEDEGQLKRSKSYYPIAKVNSHWKDLDKVLAHMAVVYVGLMVLAGQELSQQDDNCAQLSVMGREIQVRLSQSVRDFRRWSEELDGYRQELIEIQSKDENEFPSSPLHFTKGYKIEECWEWIERLPKYKKRSENEIRLDIEKVLNEHLHTTSEILTSHEQVYAEMEKVAEQLNQLEWDWEQSFETIELSGQLFVAVSGVWK